VGSLRDSRDEWRSKYMRNDVKIYGYQLSQATMRVRIAANLKGIAFEETFLDLVRGDQFNEAFRAINPQQVVPAALVQGQTTPLFQSMAILEYLEESAPEPALLPADAASRAWVRGMAQILIADTHRYSVPSTRNYLVGPLALSEKQLLDWIHHWIGRGLTAFEKHLAADGNTGDFCFGDSPTFADICLFPQIIGAKRFNIPLADYPNAARIFEHCMAMEAFKRAIPE
jgi:maleylacetoacetate isomerase